MLDTDVASICCVWNLASTVVDTLTVTGIPNSSVCVGPTVGKTYVRVGVEEGTNVGVGEGVAVGVGVGVGIEPLRTTPT